ncbi:MAG: UpxY family transcription antiterminator [Paludibacteraceae bacterium]|nr:UpxY family transcription antiterminator [Paludibacteraceae bacterium]
MKTNVYSSESELESIVPVTTDREAHPKRWIAALVQMCMEKKVGERLTKLGVENYVPTQTEIRQWSDRKKKVERVVIPMVVFIHTDEKTERSLRMQSFIRKILTYPGQTAAAVIPDDQIDRLKFMLRQSDSPVEMMEQNLQVGDKVQIVRGALRGLEGEFFKNVDKSMVAIHIEALGYACVSVSVEDIEKIER